MDRLTDAVFIAFLMDNKFSVVTIEKKGELGQEDSIHCILVLDHGD
jgi:hypothetical protein